MSVHPQPIDVSKFYQPDLHETMQPRRKRGWGGLRGGLRGGNEEATAGQNVKEDPEETSSSSISNMEISSDEEALDYGIQGSELNALLEEELHQVETEVLSVPDQGWMEVVDNILKEGGDIGMNKSADQVQVQDDDKVHCSEDAADEVKSGAKFLQQIDKDYLCSPRLVVRGVFSGEVLQLVVKRKTEGTYVDWAITNKKTNKQLLLVHGEMTYPFGLSREALSTKSGGQEVMGGWKWHGWGYGYLNLFPPSDPRVLHVDIEEAIFFGEDIFTLYHVSGRGCRNVEKSEDVICKQDECGVRIWSVKFSSFTTVEEKREYYQPRSFRKEKKEQIVYLSLVAFFNGEFKIALHRDARLKKSYEEVAWLTKDENARFHDSVAAVDRSKLQRAEQVWPTRVPKPVLGEETLMAEVIKLNVSLGDLRLFV